MGMRFGRIAGKRISPLAFLTLAVLASWVYEATFIHGPRQSASSMHETRSKTRMVLRRPSTPRAAKSITNKETRHRATETAKISSFLAQIPVNAVKRAEEHIGAAQHKVHSDLVLMAKLPEMLRGHCQDRVDEAWETVFALSVAVVLIPTIIQVFYERCLDQVELGLRAFQNSKEALVGSVHVIEMVLLKVISDVRNAVRDAAIVQDFVTASYKFHCAAKDNRDGTRVYEEVVLPVLRKIELLSAKPSDTAEP